MGFPGGLVVKNPPANAGHTGDAVSVSGSGRFPGGGSGSPGLYSCQENPMDRGASQAAGHRVAKNHPYFSVGSRRAASKREG